MRLASILLLALSASTQDIDAFSLNQSGKGSRAVVSKNMLPSSTQMKAVLNDDSDCGCASTIYSGKPTDVAIAANPRQVIRNNSVVSLDDKPIVMDDLLQKSSVSIVVFLRSLG